MIDPHIGVVDEGHAIRAEDALNLAEIRGDNVRLNMNEGVETEHQVRRSVGNHRQGHTVGDCKGGVRSVSEPVLAAIDAVRRQVHPYV
jgi:hypothetical protein